MSRKQLARTVADGRLVTFRFSEGGAFTGYLCGMDDYYWLVLQPEAPHTLEILHKGSFPRISIAPESTYEEEKALEDLEKTIKPFRDALEREGLIPSHAVRNRASEGELPQ